MVLKVDPDELLDVTKVNRKDIEKFAKEIENMQGSLEIIKRNWKGVDSQTFITNFNNFLKKMSALPKSLETLSQISDKTNEGYDNRDKEFARELKEGAINNE